MPTNDPTAPRVVGSSQIRCPALASYSENLYQQCEKAIGHDGLHRYTIGGASAEWSKSFHYLAGVNCLAAAVLPEDGTTPPSYDVGGLEAEPGFHEPFEKSLARGQLHAVSLRETGAGRGEAKSHCGLGVRYEEKCPACRRANAAASPEGGAPTEEDRKDIELLEGLAKEYPSVGAKLRRIASRLTRSPRAAGEPSEGGSNANAS